MSETNQAKFSKVCRDMTRTRWIWLYSTITLCSKWQKHCCLTICHATIHSIDIWFDILQARGKKINQKHGLQGWVQRDKPNHSFGVGLEVSTWFMITTYRHHISYGICLSFWSHSLILLILKRKKEKENQLYKSTPHTRENFRTMTITLTWVPDELIYKYIGLEGLS